MQPSRPSGYGNSDLHANDYLICNCGLQYSPHKVQPIRCSCGNKIGTHKPLDAKPDAFAQCRGNVGFIAPCYMQIGGTETWHQSLLPRLRGVNGFVSLDKAMSHGDFSRLGCRYDIGIDAARHLARHSAVLVVWNVGARLESIVAGTNCKVIAVSHGGPACGWNHQGIDQQMPWLDHVVTICNGAAAEFAGNVPVSVIPNAPDPNRIKPTQTLPKPARKLAVSISRFSTEKRLDLLADVFETHLPDWQLWLVGAKSGIGSAVVKERENVRIFEAIDTPGDYYAIADCYVQASENEGYGLSAAEALLAGLPVVSTPVGLFADRPHLATIVEHDAPSESWADAIRTARPKPIDDLDTMDGWVNAWQSLIDSLLPQGHRKAAICRSNACGRYDQATDTCGIITATGRPGQVGYLLSHPQVGCVAEKPLF